MGQMTVADYQKAHNYVIDLATEVEKALADWPAPDDDDIMPALKSGDSMEEVSADVIFHLRSALQRMAKAGLVDEVVA